MTLKRVTLFVLAVILCLGLISLVFPKDGIKVGEFTFHFPSLQEMFSFSTEEEVDISRLERIADSLANLTIVADTNIINPDTIIIEELTTRKLDFKDDKRSVLHSFFNSINSLASTPGKVRLMHYGDSQIEGDRITYYLRRKFQTQFGGVGPGIVPVVEAYNSNAVKREFAGNWRRYTVFGKRNPAVKHNSYGALASFSRYAPVQNDSIINDSVIYEASVTFIPTAYPFNRCNIFAGNTLKTVYVEIFNGENLVKQDSILPGTGLSVINVSLEAMGEPVTIHFRGKDSPDIYGVDLTGTTGVQVDNIPMRGSSGTIFTKMNGALLTQMYDKLNVKLLILQFGGNVVPYIDSEKSCSNYGNMFYAQLSYLKKRYPDVSIIVIGPSDMSMKDKERYVTYPLLPEVRDVLKEATFKAGGAYWDMFEAMGGENSMPVWVAAKPPLAAKDYIHFSPRGARLIAEMFYDALIHEYKIYQKSRKN